MYTIIIKNALFSGL